MERERELERELELEPELEPELERELELELMISCLCVTHERHEFMPWVEHQFTKQSRCSEDELIIIDSSTIPWVSNVATVVHMPSAPGISEKRTAALSHAQGSHITWFDDDDWQSPEKLLRGQDVCDNIAAIGARHASMYSVVSKKCGLYESHYEPIIFNSAVYRRSSVPPAFSEHHVVGEDTEWHERWLRSRPTFLTVGEPLHAWLCHGKNITNKANSRFFEQPCDVPFDDWERAYLKAAFG